MKHLAWVVLGLSLLVACDKGPTNSANAATAPVASPTTGAPAATAATGSVDGTKFGGGVTVADTVAVDHAARQSQGATSARPSASRAWSPTSAPSAAAGSSSPARAPARSCKFKVTDGEMVFPIDAKGKYAVAQGVVAVRELTLEETKQYAEYEAQEYGKAYDAGRRITAPTTSVRHRRHRRRRARQEVAGSVALEVAHWFRAVHRDIGYVAVALTLAYALSGIAVNHIDDWNPNYTLRVRASFDLGPLPAGRARRARRVRDRPAARSIRAACAATSRRPRPSSACSSTGGQEVRLDVAHRPRHAKTITTRAVFFEVNALHLNNLKGVWTYVADVFAIALMILAITGDDDDEGRPRLPRPRQVLRRRRASRFRSPPSSTCTARSV